MIANGAGPVEPRPVPWRECLRQPGEWYAGAEARRIADQVALYQRATGGWPKNVDMARPLSPAEREGVRAARSSDDATIDNGATHGQLRFLARVLAATGQQRLRQPILAGLDYLLRAQYPNGGWPQAFPLRRDYSRHVTFNDGAMVGVMRLLRDVASGDRLFEFVDVPRRQAAAGALERGLAFILRAQVRRAGRLVAWGAQHDEVTLAPCAARAYELPALASKETVEIAELLMEVEQPGPDVVAAVEGAVAWLRAVRIDGLRVERVAAPALPGGEDVVVRPAVGAGPLWARFYELASDRPIFVGRDGVAHASLAEIEHERRVGYSWLGPYAVELLERRYPRWSAAQRPSD